MTQKLALASCDLRKLDLCLSERERDSKTEKGSKGEEDECGL